MGMNQVYVSPVSSPTLKRVRARIYPANNQQPSPVSSYYRQNQADKSQRYLLVLDTLSGSKTQPYVHDIVVSTIYRGKSYKFRVFFKRHKLLRINQAVRRLTGVDVQGDVLIAAVGKTVGIRNLRGVVEDRAADDALEKLMEHLAPLRSRRYFPAKISL